jgi:hypothetical protein
VIGSWLTWIATLAVQAEPIFRVVSLVAATVASVYAIKYYRRNHR